MPIESESPNPEDSFSAADTLKDLSNTRDRHITLDEAWADRYEDSNIPVDEILDQFEKDIDAEAQAKEPQIEQHSLKEMSVDDLFDNLLELGSSWNEQERTMVASAFNFAANLHKDDEHREKPYTYHLLRNANRAASYLHITDPEIIVGILLHDSVEDHADEIVALPSKPESSTTMTPDDERNQAFAILQDKFSPRVAHIVEGMSNPLRPEGITVDDDTKIANYVEHVVEAIADKDVWVAKVVDWGDNGLGLIHSDLDTSTGRGAKLMRKYSGVSHALEERFHQDDIQMMLDPIAKLNIEHMFELGRNRLSSEKAA